MYVHGVVQFTGMHSTGTRPQSSSLKYGFYGKHLDYTRLTGDKARSGVASMRDLRMPNHDNIMVSLHKCR